MPAARASADRALSLLVMSRGGVFTVAVPAEGELTLGRADRCDVQIDDGMVSREHARVYAGERPAVEDLGSANGTLVNGVRLAPRTPVGINPGDMITLGTTVLVVQVAPTVAAIARIWSAEAFAKRFEEERARAEASGVGFALLRVRFDRGTLGIAAPSTATALPIVDVGRAKRLEAVMADLLRPQDVISSHAPGVYEVLLPETPADVAEALAAQLRTRYRERNLDTEVGVACYPRDGSSVDSLETRASKEAHAALASEAPRSVGAPRGAAMAKLEPLLGKIAAGAINVLVLGETGVGKEVTARSIHERSPRRARPMVCINCAALTEALLEGELFGYERGAFTGATQAKPGLIEAAEGGTVFLDEIGEMPMALQAKLLRVLEQREVQRLGSLRPKPVDVRFIAATNRDLEKEIAAGQFREDLYFRLNGVSVTIPPLRERLDELEPLASEFIARAAQQAHRRRVPRLSGPVLALMGRYAWPGNIRELRNAMERAVLLCSGDLITLEHVPSEKWAPVVPLGKRPPTLPPPPLPPEPPSRPTLVDASDALETTSAPAAWKAFEGMNERDRIVAALEACAGNQTQAAKLLGISRRTLVSRLGEYDLPRPRKKGSDEEP